MLAEYTAAQQRFMTSRMIKCDSFIGVSSGWNRTVLLRNWQAMFGRAPSRGSGKRLT
jgi:hypothetical protein